MTLMPVGAFIASVVRAGRWKCAAATALYRKYQVNWSVSYGLPATIRDAGIPPQPHGHHDRAEQVIQAGHGQHAALRPRPRDRGRGGQWQAREETDTGRC